MKPLKRDIFIAAFLLAVLVGFSAVKVIKMRKEAYAAVTARNQTKLADAITVYRGDHEGRCPSDINELTPNYLDKIPPKHKADGKIDKDGWIYLSDPSDPRYCEVFVKGEESK
jgi:hypothetical protein